MDENKQVNSIYDVIRNAPTLGSKKIDADSLILDGDLPVRVGDIIYIKANPGVGMTTFILALGLAMTKECDVFSKFKCIKPIHTLYFEGSTAYNKIVCIVNFFNTTMRSFHIS